MEYIIIIAIAWFVWWVIQKNKENAKAQAKRREKRREEARQAEEARRQREADVKEFLRQAGEEEKEEEIWWNNVATLNNWVVEWMTAVVVMVEELGKSQDKDTSYRANLLMERLDQEKLLGSSLAGFHVEDGIAGLTHLPDKMEFTLVPSGAFEKIRAEVNALWKTEHRSDSQTDQRVTRARVPDTVSRVARAVDIVYGSVIDFELLIRDQAWGQQDGGRPEIFYSSVIDFELLISYLQLADVGCPYLVMGLPLHHRLSPFRRLRDEVCAARQIIRKAVATITETRTEEAAKEVLKILADGDMEGRASALPKEAALLIREQQQEADEWAKEQEKMDEQQAKMDEQQATESYREQVLAELRRGRNE